MSDVIKYHKVVSSLPGTLEANSVYYVRVGDGVTQYVTNDIGTVVAYPLNPDTSIPTGTSAEYIAGDKTLANFGDTVRATPLTGLSTASSVEITSSDTIVGAAGKLQAQITTLGSSKEPTITAGTVLEFWRGDKTWQSFAGSVRASVITGFSATNAAIVATDTVLAAFGKTQGQINAKEGAITAGTTAQFWRGDKTWVDFATTVRGTVLTGLSTATSTDVTASDSVLTAIGKLQGQLLDSGWITLTLTNGWVVNTTFPTPAVRKIGNLVLLRGVVQTPLANNNTVAFTLPSGYRPLGATHHFSNGGGGLLLGVGVVSIATTGAATVVDPNQASTCAVSLHGCSFFV